MGILYLAAGAVFIYLLQAVLYKKLWNKNLTASVRFTQHAITEKEEGELCETIVNRKWLPLPMLRVKFEADRHLDFHQEGNVAVTDRCYKCDIFSVMMYQKIIRRLKFVANRRGLYTINQMYVDSTDLFMERHLSMEIACNSDIYVYPGQADARRLLLPFQKMMGELLTARHTYEDPFEFQGIRSYEPFDSMKDVNWKATARTGELRTNVHGHTVRQEVCLLLNLESESMMEYSDLKEESIRLANSLSGMFLSKGIPVRVISNAKDLISGEELSVSLAGGGQHLRVLRESLARLDLSQPVQEFGTLLKTNEAVPVKDVLHILISSSQRTPVCQEFKRLAAECPGSLWLLPLYSWMDQKVMDTKDISVIRWEVEQNASG